MLAVISKEKKAEYAKAYRIANREKLLAHEKAYRDANREKRNEQRRQWYLKNKEKVAAYAQARRLANPEQIRLDDKRYREKYREKRLFQEKIYRETHREIRNFWHRRWRKRNPEKVKTWGAARRARKRGATVEKVSPVEIFERDGWVCQLCGKKVNKRLKYPHPMSASLDHILALARGGEHSQANVQLAHLVCHDRAGTGGLKQLRLM